MRSGSLHDFSIPGIGPKSMFSRFSGEFDYEAGFLRAARNDGERGEINVLDGARIEIRSGIGVNEDTTAPGFQLAREFGSVGSATVDGAGSLVEIVQAGPVIPSLGGPFLQAGRSGDGTVTISNGGAISLTGADSIVQVSRGQDGEGPVPEQGKLLECLKEAIRLEEKRLEFFVQCHCGPGFHDSRKGAAALCPYCFEHPKVAP